MLHAGHTVFGGCQQDAATRCQHPCHSLGDRVTPISIHDIRCDDDVGTVTTGPTYLGHFKPVQPPRLNLTRGFVRIGIEQCLVGLQIVREVCEHFFIVVSEQDAARQPRSHDPQQTTAGTHLDDLLPSNQMWISEQLLRQDYA